MSHVNVARAWKDESYRAGLSDAERAALPVNPAGVVDLSDVQQESVNGGVITVYVTLIFGCISTQHTCNKAYCGYIDSLKTKSSTCPR